MPKKKLTKSMADDTLYRLNQENITLRKDVKELVEIVRLILPHVQTEYTATRNHLDDCLKRLSDKINKPESIRFIENLLKRKEA